MDRTIGKRIASLRKEKGLKQEQLAEMLGVSGQAVSKWENDQTCPDITLLPKLAQILGISVDELLTGRAAYTQCSQILPEAQRRDISKMMLRIVVDTAKGDKVRVNLPMALIQMAVESGIQIPNVVGNESLKNIDWNQILTMVNQGMIGNLVEVEASNGDTVRIFVE